MSAKQKKKMKKKKSTRVVTLILVVAAIVCLSMAAILIVRSLKKDNVSDVSAIESETEQAVEQIPEDNVQVETTVAEDVSLNLGHGIYITDIGKYTGIYMEDGSDDFISGVMMLVVENQGDEVIQYAEITVPFNEKEASFSLSTMLPGTKMVLLEQNRLMYEDADYTTAVMENVAVFTEELSLCEDKLQIQILDGAINVKNISDSDITGDIVIYYKNSAVDIYYGGITYRVRLEGGLMQGEIKQIMADHFSESGSTVMFVTCGESE